MSEELVVRPDPNYLGAFFSFLRLLATNVATALLPLFVLNDSQEAAYPEVAALVVAFSASFLMTVINFFRAGEVRFGPAPNVTVEDV